MIALALTTLFTAATVLALAALAQTWRQYWTSALAVRSALKQCEATRSFDYRIISRGPALPVLTRIPPQVIALPVRSLVRRPRLQPALRAAA